MNIKYLCSLLSKEELEKHGIIYQPKETVEKVPLVSYPKKIENEIIKNILSQNLWNNIRYKKTSDYSNIMDLFETEKDPNSQGSAGIRIFNKKVIIYFLLIYFLFYLI